MLTSSNGGCPYRPAGDRERILRPINFKKLILCPGRSRCGRSFCITVFVLVSYEPTCTSQFTSTGLQLPKRKLKIRNSSWKLLGQFSNCCRSWTPSHTPPSGKTILERLRVATSPNITPALKAPRRHPRSRALRALRPRHQQPATPEHELQPRSARHGRRPLQPHRVRQRRLPPRVADRRVCAHRPRVRQRSPSVRCGGGRNAGRLWGKQWLPRRRDGAGLVELAHGGEASWGRRDEQGGADDAGR